MKKTLKYQLSDLELAILIYFAIYLVITIIGIVFSQIDLRKTGRIHFNGMDFSTIIFLFVMGAAVFKEHFWMSAQNGISRKTFFKSCLCLMAISSATLAGLGALYSVLIAKVSHFQWNIMFELIYNSFRPGALIKVLVMICYLFSVYSVSFMSGYFISILFYKASTIGKICICAGLPILCFFLLPLSTMFIPSFWDRVTDVIHIIFGISSQNPLYGVLTWLAITIALSLLSYPLVKKVEI